MSVSLLVFIFVLGFFLGFVLCKFVSGGYDGKMYVDDTDEKKTKWTLEYDGDPIEIPKKKSIRFRVCIKE